MLNMDDDTFKKQIKILYYSKMPQVAHALFEQGFKDTSIASGLLVPKAVVKGWRVLYEHGELLNATPVNPGWERSGFPFDQELGQVAWTDFPYDIKRVAKAFFEMGLRARIISIYLDMPISTVYFWHGLFKKNQFETDPPEVIEPYEALGEKFTVTNNKRRYSYELRQVAKECFLKGMTHGETAKYLGLHRETVYKWKQLFNEGRFYVSEKEKALIAHSGQRPHNVHELVDKKAAKELFDVGATEQEVAATLNLSLKTVRFWNDELNTNSKIEKPVINGALKTASGFYTEEVRQAAKECFDRGMGYKLTAKSLGISAAAVKDWIRLYKAGRFYIKK